MTVSTLWDKIKEMIKNMIGSKTIEKTLHISPLVSSEMSSALQLWEDMYKDKSPWLHEPDGQNPTKVVSLGLASFIASEKARMATLELQSEITAPTETVTSTNPNYKPPVTDTNTGEISFSGEPQYITEDKELGNNERANYLNEQYKKLLNKIRHQLEYGIAEGGLVIKPYIVTKTPFENSDTVTDIDIEFDYIHANEFFPLAFDSSGKITEAAFTQHKKDKNTVYTRLEYHKLENNTVTVENKAFKSENISNLNSDDLGKEISLTEVPEWKDIPPKTVVQNVDRLLFAYFKMPEANTVDTHSPLGVSGYSRATKLIKEADLQYSRLLWEFEGGELAIDIDRDALKDRYITDDNGNQRLVSRMGHLQDRLYRQVDLGDENTYNVFSPALRDTSLINGLNTILMRIEDVCALSRGTLSDVAAEARTATELKILKQRSYSANAEIQKALQNTLEDVVYIMNVYCTLYEITTEGEYDVSFEWDDSILVDVDSELSKRITLMQNGLASKLEVRMWYFGETERQAREALQSITSETQDAIQNDIFGR